MHLLDFTNPNHVPLILSGKKTTAIRIYKPDSVEKTMRELRINPIELNLWFNQWDEHGFCFLRVKLLSVDFFELLRANPEDAAAEGCANVPEIVSQLQQMYPKEYALDMKLVRYQWAAPVWGNIPHPNRTAIDWFKSEHQSLVTINPLVLFKKGNCYYECIYCYVPPLQKRFPGNFIEGFYENRLMGLQTLKAEDNVFISSITDLFHPAIPSPLIEYCLQKIQAYNIHHAKIYLLTKNPERYAEFLHLLNPATDHIGVTLETNSYRFQDYPISQAPKPEARIAAFAEIKYPLKFCSLEPLMKFEDVFIDQILSLSPCRVFVGSNTSKRNFKIPRIDDVQFLIDRLEKHGIVVIRKENLYKPYTDQIPAKGQQRLPM